MPKIERGEWVRDTGQKRWKVLEVWAHMDTVKLQDVKGETVLAFLSSMTPCEAPKDQGGTMEMEF